MKKKDRYLNEKIIVLIQQDILALPLLKGRLEAAGLRLETASDIGDALERAIPALGHADVLLVDLLQASGLPLSPANLRVLERCGIPQVVLYPGTQPELVEKAANANTVGFIEREADSAVYEAALATIFRILEEKLLFEDAYRYSMHGVCLHRVLRDEGGRVDCEYVRVNDAFEKQTGIPVATLPGKTIRDLFPNQNADEVIALYMSAVMNRKPEHREYYFEPTASWYNLYVSPLSDTVFTVFIENITDRKNTERALRDSELHFRSVVDSGLILIWTAGTDKKCDFFNTPWLEFTGRPLEQELGNGWAEGIFPDDRDATIATYAEAFDRHERFSMEYRLRHASGEYRWIQDVGTPRYDANGAFIGYIGHCMDITPRKESETLLLKKMDELQRFQRITVNRELRMLELKREINELVARIGEPPRYRVPEQEGNSR